MSVEQEEARKALDAVAREVHGIYGQHAVDKGLGAPPRWEDLPDEAKAISRDISRLIVAKMQDAYHEGLKMGKAEGAVEKADKALDAAAGQRPKPWTPKEAVGFLAEIKPLVESYLDRIHDLKNPSPIVKAVDAAIAKVIEKSTLDVIAGSPSIIERIHQIVESEVEDFFKEGDGE